MSRQERTEKILQHIIPEIQLHQQKSSGSLSRRSFILGLTGLQGCGKSTLASDIVETLNSKYNFRSIEISLDDFYKTHAERQALAATYPENGLLRVRGQPGTHDTTLASWFFDSSSHEGLHGASPKLRLPFFDKSLFAGSGDRRPEAEWRQLDRQPFIDVLVFEGWCLGFQPLPEKVIESKLQHAYHMQRLKKNKRSESGYEVDESQFSTTTLAENSLQDLLFINRQLEEYCNRFMGPHHFDSLIHLDTVDLRNVYMWRLEQERALRKSRGAGMTDDEVVHFSKSTRCIII